MDENDQPINQTMTEDIMSLPQEVSALVTEEAVGECAMDVITQWVEDPEHARCTDKYTAVDLDKIEEVLIMVANYKCFQNIFNQACHGFVQNKIYQLFSSAIPSLPAAQCQSGSGGVSGGGSWPQEPEVENTYIAKGEMVDLDPNMKGYLVGSGQKVVVWSTDTAGITGENSKKKTTKEWADFLAEEGGYTVLVPDWFRGNNAEGLYPDPAWTMQVTNWTRIQADWNNVVLPYLETKLTTPLTIGLIGTCWGSYPVVFLSRFENIKCGISMHPSHPGLIDTLGQSETEVLSQIVAPQLFMTEGISFIPGGVPDSVKPGGLAEQILGDKLEIEMFDDMMHGWTVGGDLSDPDVARDVNRAKTLALEFFFKYL